MPKHFHGKNKLTQNFHLLIKFKNCKWKLEMWQNNMNSQCWLSEQTDGITDGQEQCYYVPVVTGQKNYSQQIPNR